MGPAVGLESVAARARVLRLVLIGAPNVGKSALFGRLTGIYAVVSNYPGTSVEVTRGRTAARGRQIEVIDTPGMYGMLSVTEEERVARRAAVAGGRQTIIHVVDARHLERSLPLTLQLVSLGQPVVVACNLLDELLDVDRDRHEAERAQGFPVQLAHLGADAQAATIGGRADRPHPVRDVTESVVP